MLENYGHEQLRGLVGHEVHDRDGEMVGYVDLVFNDVESGRPEWMGVWRGFPGSGRHLVPIRGITHDADEIVLPWTKADVEGAPGYDEEDDRTIFDDEPHFGISQETEDEAYRHYRLEQPAEARSGPRLRVWVYTERAETIVRR